MVHPHFQNFRIENSALLDIPPRISVFTFFRLTVSLFPENSPTRTPSFFWSTGKRLVYPIKTICFLVNQQQHKNQSQHDLLLFSRRLPPYFVWSSDWFTAHLDFWWLAMLTAYLGLGFSWFTTAIIKALTSKPLFRKTCTYSWLSYHSPQGISRNSRSRARALLKTASYAG